ncbi:LD-carboxypeptidase [Glycomyces sp. TRM65418]|uniref:S66 peptidase family protein n=1 Tax=Glycomyces sp. TRM65418 TaxID=2867006 RepID=UPI001CE52B06|nr:LD-carboxypeptidase [Glycomyces sp. TRM65418]MCC3765305.1 LD-carboxypeptidase [Glycomyces sp. TRM65418]QZD54923.1 LD-carboxypeptidase [Glycomyces sp. TRM65418]
MSLAPLRRPRRLVPGDRVAVLSPSSPAPAERFDAAFEALRGWGLDPVLMPHARDRYERFDQLAGTDAARAADFQAAWADPQFAAVFAARGGYGANRMVDLVDWAALREAEPKALIGFSDVTTLHEAVALHLGVASIHGPMPTWSVFLNDRPTNEHLRQTLFAPELTQKIASPTARAIVGGSASGVTAGGCLAMLANGIGTAEHRGDLEGAILLIEDTDERPYRIDRMLTHLRRAGWFDGLAGVVAGSFAACGPYEPIRTVLEDQFGDLGVPVVEEFGFGHCEPAMTVPLGLRAVLDADAGMLHFGEPALA